MENAISCIFYRYLFFFVFFYATGFLSKAQAQIISTIAGTGTPGFSGDGLSATSAEINYAKGIAIKETGGIYFSDQVNFRIRTINSSGIITTVAGTGAPGFGGDGSPATLALINSVKGITIDAAGNLFLADQVNYRIRKIDTAGIINTIAGNGTPGFSGDGSPATSAQFNHPSCVIKDGLGNLYIADVINDRVRKIDTFGIITTYAGGGLSGFVEGELSTAAQLGSPQGIALDALGNLYISDPDNYSVRKVNSLGIITTFAGNGTMGFSGDRGPATAAQLNNPSGLAVDDLNNLYIADQGNNRIRKVDASGIITTIVGNGTAGYTGDEIPATAAELNGPIFVAIDCARDVYINDNLNNRIRKVTYDHPPIFAGGHYQVLAVCKNSVSVSINSLLAVTDIDTGQNETWSLVMSALHGTVMSTYGTSSTGGLLTPVGMSYTPVTGYTGYDTFIVRIYDCGVLTDTTTVYVTVDSIPATAGTIFGLDSLCPGHTINLSDTLAGGAWACSNSRASISGGVVMGSTSGADTILYIVSNTCGADTAKFAITVLPVSLSVCTEDIHAVNGQPETGITIFPNPNNGSFSFNITSYANEVVHIAVINMLGEKVREITATTNKTDEITLNAPAGVYFLSANTGESSYKAKVVITK